MGSVGVFEIDTYILHDFLSLQIAMTPQLLPVLAEGSM